MENDKRKSVPSVAGIEDNEVPNVKGLGETVKEEKIDVTSIPTSVKEDNTIDPLAMPSVSTKKAVEDKPFDINSIPASTSSGSSTFDKSKLPLILGIVGGVIVILAIIIIIVNNTGNKLSCSKEEGGSKVSYKIRFDKDDKVKSATLDVIYDADKISYLKDKSDSELDEYVDTMKNNSDDDYQDYNVKRNGRKIVVSASKNNFEDSEMEKKSDIKRDLEDEGFTCK